MSEYTLIPLIEVALTLLLLVALAVRGKRHIARKPFAVFLLCMAFWGIFIFLMRGATTLASALFWERFVLVAIVSAALFFYRFTITFTESRPRKHVYYTLHALYLMCLALIPTDLIVSDMQMMWYGKAPVVGIMFAPYVLTSYAPLVIGLVTLIRHGRHSSIRDEKVRQQYIVAGMIAMFVGGTTDYLPPLGVSMYPLGIVGNIMFCVLATVAMLRYNPLEMKVVLRKGLAYSLAGAMLVTVFGGLIFLLSSVFQTALSPISLTITIVSGLFAIIAVTFLQPMLPVFQRIVDRWFFRERYDHLQTLKRFTHETRSITDLRQLSSSLVTAIANGMQSRSVYLLLQSPKVGDFVSHAYYGQSKGGPISFTASSLLTLTMKHQDDPIDIVDADISPTLSVLTGKSTGGGTSTLTFLSMDGLTTRVSVTADGDGNRTSVGTRDGT